MRIAGAQLNLVVGDLAGNETKIAEAIDWAEDERADVCLLPELAVSGYPPEDLVLRAGYVDDNLEVIGRLARRSRRTTALVGFVDRAEGHPGDAGDSRRVANAVAILGQGELVGVYHKVLLPNYGVFDENRYFTAGQTPDRVWDIAGIPAGVSICEDIWLADGPPQRQVDAGARILFNVNGSPFQRGKAAAREAMLATRAKTAGVPVVYLNLVGGQDELVFDGASMVVAADGTVIHRSPQFAEDRFVVDVPLAGEPIRPIDPEKLVSLLDPVEEIYRALGLGVGDYVRKNGFGSVVIGLSGGIDSALTAAIATDAIGADRVWGIAMPSRFSSESSVTHARQLAASLGIRFDIIPMDTVFGTYLDTLAPIFAGTDFGVAEENLQARIRGAILMAVSNKFGPMVLTTGNKSEMAVGYATLYGDMVGGYSALKDVFKTVVYDLARWRNRGGEVIPPETIDKPPSAELRPDQRDSDSLPPYELLDAILERYIEDDLGVEEIVADGFDPQVAYRVAAMVDRTEYKRRQSAPGVKITTKAFGRDRRLPITNHYRRGSYNPPPTTSPEGRPAGPNSQPS